MRTRFTWFAAGACLLLSLAPAFGSGGSEAPATKAQPVTTLKVTSYHAANDSFEAFYDTPVGKLIERETNVRVQIVGKPSDTYQALLADLASDSLPDISVFWAQGNVYDAMVKAATEGMLAPLSKAIAQHGPIIDYAMKRQVVAAEMKELYFRPEFKGETYLVPTHYSVQQPWLGGYGLYIRGDVADQLGIKSPDRTIRTPDDLYSLLMKIKNAGAKDINGKPAYPMGSFTWGGIVYDVMGRPYAFGGPSLIGADKGKVKSFIESDEWSWNYIKWMRKLVKDGLVDPEMFTD